MLKSVASTAGLEPATDSLEGQFSGGMKGHLDLAWLWCTVPGSCFSISRPRGRDASSSCCSFRYLGLRLPVESELRTTGDYLVVRSIVMTNRKDGDGE
jgi:hypothetical protein